MAFKKGESGNIHGRKKGSANKYRPDVAKMFLEWDFNPLKNLKDLALRTDDDDVYFQCNKELAQYYAPKLKSVELSNTEQSPLKFTINISRNDDDKLPGNEDSSGISS